MVERMAGILGSLPVRGWHAAALGVECLPGRIAGLVAMVVHAGVSQPECIDSMRYRRRKRCQEDGKASYPGSEGTTIWTHTRRKLCNWKSVFLAVDARRRHAGMPVTACPAAAQSNTTFTRPISRHACGQRAAAMRRSENEHRARRRATELLLPNRHAIVHETPARRFAGCHGGACPARPGGISRARADVRHLPFRSPRMPAAGARMPRRATSTSQETCHGQQEHYLSLVRRRRA